MWPSRNKNIDRMEFMLTLRRHGITDNAVLRAMDEVPREMFVAVDTRAQAYQDHALPIDCGQTISQPYVVAFMTELLELQSHHRVLEIGTGSGYQAAILARLCRHVYTLERHEELHEQAQARFEALGIDTITAIAGDGTKGWPEPRQFDRIIVTAAARKIPDALVVQLKQGGRMILPLKGKWSGQRLVLVEKTADGIAQQDLLPVRFVPLIS
jgi:protein-L-isoaspartate(D-aspartate) O-methyltransferase